MKIMPSNSMPFTWPHQTPGTYTLQQTPCLLPTPPSTTPPPQESPKFSPPSSPPRQCCPLKSLMHLTSVYECRCLGTTWMPGWLSSKSLPTAPFSTAHSSTPWWCKAASQASCSPPTTQPGPARPPQSAAYLLLTSHQRQLCCPTL